MLVALAVNTLRQGSRQINVPPAPVLAVDVDAAAQRLAGAVQLRTISFDEHSAIDAVAFRKLHAWLEASFPRTHAALERETVNELSLLYTWPGSDPAAKPILLMAHQDVVPVAADSESDWQAPPFSGEIRDGYLWGRGAWDDKASLLAIFEAIEALLAEGFQPRQTVYLALGHDEEIGGEQGARAIAERLAARGVRLDFVLDEGLLITEGVLAGLHAPLALIGVAEKGYLTLELEAQGASGHSSMPSAEQAIGRLAAALSRLEQRPMPAGIHGVAGAMFDTIAPEMTLFNRVLLSNRWLFGPLVRRELEKRPSSQAMLRTTTAFTVLAAGNKENVLPGRARALVNFRLLPGDRIEAVEAHVRAAIADESITIRRRGQVNEAVEAGVGALARSGYRAIERTVREVFPDTRVAPGLMIGTTDSRHMAPIAEAIYRFAPVQARQEDLARFHGINERISLANHAAMIRFYHQLLRNVAQPAQGDTP